MVVILSDVRILAWFISYYEEEEGGNPGPSVKFQTSDKSDTRRIESVIFEVLPSYHTARAVN